MILDAARSYRIDTGAWPGGATCANALAILKNQQNPYLTGVAVNNRYNSPYSTSCTSKSFSVDQNAVADWDGYIANTLAGTEIVDAGDSHLRSTIGIPGSEPALDGKLSRVATGNAELNRMRTMLYMGGNNIAEVGRIEANEGAFSGNVTAGSVTAGTVSASTVSAGGVSANSVSSAAVGAGTLTVAQAAVIAGALQAQGESQFGGRVTFNDVMVLNKIAVEGTGGCTTGSLARNTVGKLLNCESGIWRAGSGGAPEFQAIKIPGYASNDVVSYPCPAGYTKIGWDTTGSGWRQSSTGGIIIGQNDYATVFCAKF